MSLMGRRPARAGMLAVEALTYAVSVLEARTDVVGSLLRPPELLEARRQLEAGELSRAAFKRVEDRAVDEALALQEEAGLEVVTDGEMRRLSFQSQLPAAVDGFGEWDIDAFLWGEWHSDEVGDLTVERPPIAVVRTAPAAAVALRRGVRVCARAHRPRPEGHAAQPQSLRELLRP